MTPAAGPDLARSLELYATHRGTPVVELELQCTKAPTVIAKARDGVMIPVCLRFPVATASMYACGIAGAQTAIPLAGATECPSWLIGNIDADGGTLRICPAAGAPSYDTPCLWGCKAGAPDHCGVLSPSGGALVSSDLAPAGLPDVVLGVVTISSDTGSVSGSFTGQLSWTNANGISVFRANSIQFTGSVTLRGSRPIAFAANGDITVSALIDAQGSCVLTAAGPGGFLGGEFHTGATSPLTGGGGGGGVGRIRINTRSGNVMGSGTLSPSYTDIPSTTTKDLASVQ